MYQSNRNNWIVVAVVVIVTVVITIGTLRSSIGQQTSGQMPQTQRTPPEWKQAHEEFKQQFPIADYDAPESADPEKRAKRIAKNRRYDNRSLVSRELPISDDEERMVVIDPPPPGLPGTRSFIVESGLPAAESEIVVVGEILGAEAHLSNNKQDVYSEFTVRVDAVLKNSPANVTEGSLITIDREGGFVRYRNGKMRLYRIGGFAMPHIGQRYVLFLNNLENSPNYRILTGYELKENTVESLNGFPQFMVYNGMNIAFFMQAVREAIAKSSQIAPNQ